MDGLRQYLTDAEAVPFSWSDNNCMSFVSGALKAQGLSGLPAECCGGFDGVRGAIAAHRRLLKEFGSPDIIAAFDERFERVLTLHPRDGMICARPSGNVTRWAFGVAWGRGCVYLTANGAAWFEVRPDDVFWWQS